MIIAQIQIAFWEKVYNVEVGDFNVGMGEYVILEIESGLEALSKMDFRALL